MPSGPPGSVSVIAIDSLYLVLCSVGLRARFLMSLVGPASHRNPRAAGGPDLDGLRCPSCRARHGYSGGRCHRCRSVICLGHVVSPTVVPLGVQDIVEGEWRRFMCWTENSSQRDGGACTSSRYRDTERGNRVEIVRSEPGKNRFLEPASH